LRGIRDAAPRGPDVVGRWELGVAARARLACRTVEGKCPRPDGHHASEGAVQVRVGEEGIDGGLGVGPVRAPRTTAVSGCPTFCGWRKGGQRRGRRGCAPGGGRTPVSPRGSGRATSRRTPTHRSQKGIRTWGRRAALWCRPGSRTSGQRRKTHDGPGCGASFAEHAKKCTQ
jgi:hypothetical protein